MTAACNVKVRVHPSSRATFLSAIFADAGATLAKEKNALQFVVGEDIAVPNVFHFHEQYRKRSDLDFHSATPHFAKWKAFCDSEPSPLSEPRSVSVFSCDHVGIVIPPREAYCLNVEIAVRPERRTEFLELALEMVRGTQEDEPLCLQYHFGESEDENVFYFHEEFTGTDGGKEGLDAHNASPHFASFLEFAATDPFVRPPVIDAFRSFAGYDE